MGTFHHPDTLAVYGRITLTVSRLAGTVHFVCSILLRAATQSPKAHGCEQSIESDPFGFSSSGFRFDGSTRMAGSTDLCTNAESKMKNQLKLVHLFFLLLGASCFAVDAGAVSPENDKYEKLKITRFQASGEFVWCGTKNLALSTGKNAGIRLLNIDSGQIRQVTTVKTHRAVSCTTDGRHLFFVDNMVHGEMNELDIETGKRQVVYSENKLSHEVIEEIPLSPSGEYLLGPSTLSEQVWLSDRTLKWLHIPNVLSGESIDAIAWSEDGTLFVTFGEYYAKKLLILAHKNTKVRVINLPNIIKGSLFRPIDWSDRTKRLYLLVWDGSEEKEEETKLYEIDPERLQVLPRLIDTDVDIFKLLANGNLVYTKTLGVSPSPDEAGKVVFDEKTAHVSLLLRTTRGKLMELLRIPYLSLAINSIQIPPSGDAVAVGIVKIDGHNVLTEIQILHPNK